jgi:regulator of replication initiation timing
MALDSYDGNEPLSDQPRERKRNNVAIILLILLLLGSIGFNIYQYSANTQQIEKMSETLVSTQSLRDDLQKQRDSIAIELNKYKGINAELDSTVAGYERELQSRQNEIDRLLKTNKISYSKYLAVKEDIDRYEFYAAKHLQEIDELKKKVQELTVQNEGLKQENKEKKKSIDSLSDKAITLDNRLSLASRLVAQDITVTGVKFKKGNKERETNRGDDIEKLKICFSVPENNAAAPGKRDLFIQLLDPHGQTVAIEALGSGVTPVEGGESVMYTAKDQLEYNNEPVNQCLYWGKGSKFDPGQYTVVLYTEGYKIGEKSFTIR